MAGALPASAADIGWRWGVRVHLNDNQDTLDGPEPGDPP